MVGVSGGADSLCLLDCLQRLGNPCVVAHLDHGLRRTSAQEADRVAALAGRLGLPFETARVDLSKRAGSIEGAARVERYRFLASVAHSHSVAVVAVGHTADDQAETVLMHLLRGAGPEGLRGMSAKSSLGAWVGVEDGGALSLIRPLLGCSRQETEAHCAAVGLQPIVDQSNQDLSYFRNRLRHELLPELARYNPQIRQVLLRMAQVMASEAQMVGEMVDRDWAKLVRVAGPKALALQGSKLRQAPRALQRAVLRRAVLELRPELRDIGFDTIEQIVHGLDTETSIRFHIAGGLEALTLDGELVIREPEAVIAFPELPQLAGDLADTLPIPGAVDLAGDWRLLAESPATGWRPPQSRWETIVDPQKLSGDLVVRTPAAGERFEPLGMSGTVKLSDLFINRKIPWPARQRWPVVWAGTEVVWVAGLHVSRRVAPDSASGTAVRLCLERGGQSAWW